MPGRHVVRGLLRFKGCANHDYLVLSRELSVVNKQRDFLTIRLNIWANSSTLKPSGSLLTLPVPHCILFWWHQRSNENVHHSEIKMSLLYLFQLQLQSRVNPPSWSLSKPSENRPGVMFTLHTRATSYKLVPLGVSLLLWSQWLFAKSWLNMWGSRRCIRPRGWMHLFLVTFAVSSCSRVSWPMVGND